MRQTSPHRLPSDPSTQRCLCVVFLVALVTAAVFWTAAEADEGLLKGPHRPQRVVLQKAVCARPSDGEWVVVNEGIVGSFSYRVDMSAVTGSIYQGVPTAFCIRSR